MTRQPSDDEVYWSYDEFVSAYRGGGIQVSVNHPAICSLCDSVLEHTSETRAAYQSSKLWFWLLPGSSILSLFVLGPFGIIVIIIAIAVSVFKIGADVRRNAYDCIVEASLREPMVFRLLWGQRHLLIQRNDK